MTFGGVVTLLLLLNYLLVPVLIVNLLLRRKEPASLAAWGLLILIVPFLGMMVYWVFGSERIPRKARRRKRRIAKLSKRLKRQIKSDVRPIEFGADLELAPTMADVEQLGRRLANMPATGGNNVVVLHDTEAMFKRLAELIDDAQHHLHLSYYVWNEDDTGQEFRDHVIRAAQRGVECRVLLDAAGSFGVTKRFLQPLHDAGVRVHFFLPHLIKHRRMTINFRNHRKIAIADGRVALIGSQNIGDEYRGRDPELPVWIDTNLRLIGPAVSFLQEVFAEDWFYTAKEDLNGPLYFPPPRSDGRTVVQIMPTGPDQTSGALEHILFGAVSQAKRSIRIVTPYFVPDRAIRMGLRHAALRGVRVEILVSQQTDVAAIIWASRSYYAELVEVGVAIHEWPLGMLHSKFMTVDDEWAVIGSANVDVRSFRLNFELTAIVYDNEIAVSCSQWFEQRREEAQQVGLEQVYGWPLRWRLACGLARLISPVL